jgi:exopolysaccharide biosynthesis polyprenyl glycosylphosphotransferase
MRRPTRWETRYLARVVSGDLLAWAIAAAVALTVGPRGPGNYTVIFGTRVSYLVVALVGVMLWMIAAASVGAYERLVLGEGTEEFRRVVLATAAWLGAIALFVFATVTPMSRGLILAMGAGGGVLSLVGRDLNRRWLQRRRARGLGVRRVLVYGTPARAEQLRQHLELAPWCALQVVGTAGSDSGQVTLDIGDPIPALTAAGADTLAVVDTADLEPDALRTLAERLEGSGFDLLVMPSLTEVAGPRIHVRPVSGLPLLHLEEPQLTGPARFAKAVIDRTLALVLLALTLVPLALIAIAIRTTSRGPAIFKQVRVGRDGRPFTMYKLRTMVVDAESRRVDLDANNEADGPLFKLRDDPRVTPLGRWLRRHSVDELPQLVNVLIGQMSLVGPRPMLPAEADDLSDRAGRRMLVKPGITGLWQVSGRSEANWDDTMRLDLYYVENWSLSLDLVIILRTVLAVVQGRGAF